MALVFMNILGFVGRGNLLKPMIMNMKVKSFSTLRFIIHIYGVPRPSLLIESTDSMT